MDEQIALTKTVTKGGCAAKVSAVALREILHAVRFPPVHDALLVDGSTFDDAAVYKVTEDIALVQTLDFFTPIVNDAYAFGQVASANALSDVYAMGGIPKTCLAILAFPVAKFPPQLGAAVLQGASDKIAEAGATFVGGHSIDDDTLKFGLSVTGFVHPKHIWTNAGAKPGDVLILTKPLGTGTIVAGLKADTYTDSDIADVIASMSQLNRVGELLSQEQNAAITAATDITGFGIAGHAQQLAQASGVALEIRCGDLPVFSKTFESLAKGHLTKAHVSNKSYTATANQFSGLTEEQSLLLFDPQTSGGLLLAVSPDFADEILNSIKKSFSQAAMVGSVQVKDSYLVTFLP